MLHQKKRIVDEIDRAYDANEHIGDNAMEASLMQLACERVRMFERDVLGKYRNVLEGLSVARSAQRPSPTERLTAVSNIKRAAA